MEDLKTHNEAAQKKVKYSFAQCQYKATTQGSLNIHIESVHMVFKYPCSFCECRVTFQENFIKLCFDILSSQIIMSRIHTKSHWICRHIVKRVSGLAGSGLATVKLFFSVSNNLAS